MSSVPTDFASLVPLIALIGSLFLGFLLLGSLCLWLAATLTGVSAASPGWVVAVTAVTFFAEMFLSVLLYFVFSVLPFLAPVGPFVNYILWVLILQFMFGITFGGAFVCTIVCGINTQRLEPPRELRQAQWVAP